MKQLFLSITIFLYWQINAKAQSGIVHGIVYNEREEPFGNAVVITEPGVQKVSSDASGKFTLTGLPRGKTKITVSFAGYTDAIEEVDNIGGNDRIQIVIYLKPKINPVKEVIIIGYARQIKKDVIGNISRIRAPELTVNPGISLDAALQGKAPGIQVIQSGGIAGAGALIRVRGIASVSANGEPLFVLDGLPINQDQFIQIGLPGSGQQNNPLGFLNIADIESVDVLKDAAATGIYGSRGANGVIYITTKNHKIGDGERLTIISSLGTSTPTVKLRMANSAQWMAMYQEAWKNDGNTGKPPLPDGVSYQEAFVTNTDWVNEITRIGLKSESQFTYAYKIKKFRLYNSFGYLNAGSYIKENNFGRFTTRFNGIAEINRKTRLRFGLMLSNSVNNRQSQSSQGGLGVAYSSALPIFKTDRITGFGAEGNPVLRRRYQTWHTDELRFLGFLSYEKEIFRNVIWEIKFSTDQMNLTDNLFINKNFFAKDGIPLELRRSLSQLRNYKAGNYLVNSNLIYHIRKTSKTDYNILTGCEYQRSNFNSFNYRETGLNRELTMLDIQPHNKIIDWEAWAFVSTFMRMNAKIYNKWLFQASYRIDGSSRFGVNHRLGHFPSLAAGYLISEEKWLKESKKINFLKIRSGWGLTGSSAIPSFIQYGTFGNPTPGATYNGQGVVQPLNQANPNLKWEVCRVIDAGIEASFFQNRMYMELSVYDRQTSDVLLDRRIPSSTGIVNANDQFRYFGNIGNIRNRGIELLINAVIIDKFNDEGRRQAWQIKFNTMHNSNKVLNMGELHSDAIVGGGETRVLENQPMGAFYLVRFSHVDKQTGEPVFLDRNGKQTKTFSLDDRVVTGNVQPKAVGFLENRFDLGRLGFSFSFYGVLGGKIYDEAARRQLTMLSGGNVQTDIVNRWQYVGDEAKYPKLTLDPLKYGGLDNIANYHTTQWLYDASFLRLREVSFNFRIKEAKPNVQKGVRAISAQIGFFNLWLISKYPGDPEVIRDYSMAAMRNISPNVSNLTSPQERSVMLTIKLEW